MSNSSTCEMKNICIIIVSGIFNEGGRNNLNAILRIVEKPNFLFKLECFIYILKHVCHVLNWSCCLMGRHLF